MKLYSRIAAITVALGWMALSSSAQAQQMMTIYVDGRHILSTDTYTFEIYDRVCNTSRGTVTVRGANRTLKPFQSAPAEPEKGASPTATLP